MWIGRLVLVCILAALAIGPVVFAQETPAAEAPADNPLGIQARAGLLMDTITGEVLYSFDEHEIIQPASLAKIMTFELILEALGRGTVKLDDKATVSEKAWRFALDNNLSNMFLEVGDQVTIRDLLLGLMVSSGNDASVVLAEHLGISEDAFVNMMNDRARELGMKDTVFKNSHGLDAEGQATTAFDIAILSRHLINNHPDALKYTSALEFTYNDISQPNWNELIGMDERVDGLKTGHLNVSGYHLAATAREGGMRLIAVVLGAESRTARANEATKLLNYGFQNFATVNLNEALKASLPGEVPVYKGDSRRILVGTASAAVVTVPRGREKEITVTVDVPTYLVAPVERGSKIGDARLLLGEMEIKSIDLVAEDDVARGGLLRVLFDSIRLFFRNLFN